MGAQQRRRRLDPTAEQLEIVVAKLDFVIGKMDDRMQFEQRHIRYADQIVDLDIPKLTACKPYLPAIEVRWRLNVAHRTVDHVEEKVVLLYLHNIAVVFELCPAFGTKHDDAMVLQTHASRGQSAQILHHNQIVAVAYPISVAPSPRF